MLPHVGTVEMDCVYLWDLQRSPPRAEERLPSQTWTVGHSVEDAADEERTQSRQPCTVITWECDVPASLMYLWACRRMWQNKLLSSLCIALCLAYYVLFLVVSIC